MQNKAATFPTKLFSLIVVLSSLTACSSDGGDDGTGVLPDNSLLNGIWTGTASSNDPRAETADIYALAYNGDAIVRGKTSTSRSFDAGTYALISNTFVMNLEGYDTSGVVPETVYSTLQGTYSTKSSMNGTYTNSTGDSGGFSLVYQNIYERSSSLNTIAGNWLGGSGEQLFIAADGSFTGGDSLSCTWNGTVSIIDATINLYDVSMSFTTCADILLNGAWSGFATIEDDAVAGTNNAMRLLASQDAGSVAGGIRFIRQ